MKHCTLVVFAENTPGVLNKISSLIRKKMFNVESITAYECEQKGISRITITVNQDDKDNIEQIRKQIEKIVEVQKVIDVTDKNAVERELVLIKVSVGNGSRAEISDLTSIFRGNIVDVSKKSMIVEIVGSTQKIESALKVFRDFKVIEIARTGVTAMER